MNEPFLSRNGIILKTDWIIPSVSIPENAIQLAYRGTFAGQSGLARRPISHCKVTQSAGKNVDVDIYGPMPSSKHVVVVQDLASNYHAAKIISFSAADRVIPDMADFYDTYRNSTVQLYSNGSRFNCKKMK